MAEVWGRCGGGVADVWRRCVGGAGRRGDSCTAIQKRVPFESRCRPEVECAGPRKREGWTDLRRGGGE